MPRLARTHGAMDTTAMNRSSLALAVVGITMLAALSLACSDSPTSTGTTPTYPVGGMVTGLEGSGLVLRNNGGDDLGVTANGPVVFATPLASGASYSVTVLTQPTSPGQTCVVASGRGTVTHADVTTVGIFCAPNTYTVGGTVSGLVGTGLVLRNNGGDDLAVSSNGTVTFASSLSSGAAYGVTVFKQPTSPAQSCEVTGGNGTVATANVTNIAITCATNPNIYTVGGTVSGLVGSGLVLRNNGGDNLNVATNGSFTFTTPFSSGAAYVVTVFTQPASPAQTCSVTGGSGTVVTANITNVAIVCSTSAYTVGGTVSGLVGLGLVLRNNDGDDLAVSANGSVTFATLVASGAAYSVTVFTQPTSPAQSCAVTNGNGTVAAANITTVVITCSTGTPQLYSVGGTISGLVGSGLVLRNNGGDDLAVSGNGTFSFATPLVSGAAFSVTVLSQPTNPAQTCVVTGGSGTVNSGIPIVIIVACTTNRSSGTLRVTVSTTGTDVPATYGVYEGGGRPGYIGTVPSNGRGSFTLGSGHHTVSLLVATNCTVTSSNNVSVTVAAGARTDVAFSVTCLANPTIQVTVVTTGTNAPASYLVNATEILQHLNHTAFVPSNGTVSFNRPAGTYTVKLTVPLDCTVIGNTQYVTVAPGATTSVAFSVNCGPPGTLAVTALTTGSNAPATYLVGVDSYFNRQQHRYRYQYIAVISSNGAVSQILRPGSHTVNLLVPLNCSVTSPNNVSVTVASSATTDLGFSVSCQ